MRHNTEPTNHKCLTAVVVAVFLCFVAMVAWQADKENDAAIRFQLIFSNRT